MHQDPPDSPPPAVRRKHRTWLCVAVGTAALLIGACRPDPSADPSAGVSTPATGAVSASSSTALPDGSDPSTVSTATASGPPPQASPILPAEAATTALQALALLPVRDPAPTAGYSRAQFGQAWSDDVTVAGGHNGCDTRNDTLRRDLTSTQIKAGTNGCVVLSGTLNDPYTGQTVDFVRGATTSDAVQVDHVVALSDAWRTGGQQLTAAERANLANDPLNLQAVTGTINAAKGDGDAAGWLPPDTGYRCDYVTRQINVKTHYRLWVTPAERDAISETLTGCGADPMATAPVLTANAAITATATFSSSSPPTIEPVPSPGAVYYRSCAEATAAGVAPLYEGQPGYRAGLDGDRDGVACEPHR